MRKTILTFTAVCLFAVTGTHASNGTVDFSDSTADISALTSYDISSFCKAIVKGDLETVKKLIELGEDVNQKSLGKTPAIFAAIYNKAEILEVLIENGANLKIKSDKGFTAKKYAESSNSMEALDLINTALKS